MKGALPSRVTENDCPTLYVQSSTPSSVETTTSKAKGQGLGVLPILLWPKNDFK